MGMLTAIVLTPSAPPVAFAAATVGLFVPTIIGLLIDGGSSNRLAAAAIVFVGIAIFGHRLLHGLLVASVRTAIGESRRAESLEQHLADRDPLTGLHNRRSFTDHVHGLVAASPPTSAITVTVVNVRRMTAINELYGADAGNEVVAALARLLASKETDAVVAARPAGDEFAIATVRPEGVEPACLPSTLTVPTSESGLLIEVGLRTATVTASVADVSGGSLTVADLLADAAAQLRAAHRVERARPPVAAGSIAERRELTLDLRNGIAAAGLAAWFQPIVDRTSRTIVAWEALARWSRNGEVILPDRFLPLVDLGGMHTALFDAMLRDSLDFLRQLDRLGFTHHGVHVNLIPSDLGRPGLAEDLAMSLQSTGIDPSRLVVEITEEHVLDLDDAMRTALDELATMGVHVAVDDFGTGYSSLTHLLDLPTDHIKIDRRFVAGATDDDDAVTLVRALIGLANGLGVFTVAEGVETIEQARVLARLGVDQMQGYLVAPALPIAEALAFAQQRRTGLFTTDAPTSAMPR
jgi:diguanylate cyclase (GGDEF)-like protein